MPVCRVQALVIRIDLPGVSSAAAAQLDVAADTIRLEVPEKYALHLRLKHRVNADQGAAKFNTAKQQLTLTLPVVKPPAVQQQRGLQQQEQQHGQQTLQQEQQPMHPTTDVVPHRQDGSSLDPQQAPLAPAIVVSAVSDCGLASREHSASNIGGAAGCAAQMDQEQQCAAEMPGSLAAGTDVADDAQHSAQKTNQQMWSELHRKLDQELHSVAVKGALYQATAAIQGKHGQQQQQPEEGHQHAGYAGQCRATAALQLRLSGQRVSAADLM